MPKRSIEIPDFYVCQSCSLVFQNYYIFCCHIKNTHEYLLEVAPGIFVPDIPPGPSRATEPVIIGPVIDLDADSESESVDENNSSPPSSPIEKFIKPLFKLKISWMVSELANVPETERRSPTYKCLSSFHNSTDSENEDSDEHEVRSPSLSPTYDDWNVDENENGPKRRRINDEEQLEDEDEENE